MVLAGSPVRLVGPCRSRDVCRRGAGCEDRLSGLELAGKPACWGQEEPSSSHVLLEACRRLQRVGQARRLADWSRLQGRVHSYTSNDRRHVSLCMFPGLDVWMRLSSTHVGHTKQG